jgi:AraC family transcriptional regulator of adaptative response/methylated-DNA-[protein]-cysteine methyltransferase
MSDSTTYSTTYSNDYQLIAAAIAYLETNRLEQPSLDDLAGHLAISPFHLQRLFKRWAGISPKRFVQFLTVEHAKELLAQSHSLLDAAYASGLSGPSRLHDLFVSVEAMTPGEFKGGGKGLTIYYGVHPTPFGDCLLAVTERGVCGLTFLNGGGEAAEVAALHERWPAARLAADCNMTAPVAARIFAPATHDAAPLPVLLAGTNFQIKVWEALLRIPPGQVCTYADIAQSLGQPTAARAVGGAVGANHIAYLIPCHRVIRKSGIIQDYRWGSARKKAILGWEAAQLEAA